MLLTNLPARGWMSYEALARRRADLIMLRLTGNTDAAAARSTTPSTAPAASRSRPGGTRTR